MVYAYNAALYCVPCGTEICNTIDMAKLVELYGEDWDLPYDTDHYPLLGKNGESDSPDHCGECGEFLENPLTDDGVNYVVELAQFELERDGKIGETVGMWMGFYGISLEKK